jgi:hypothetical protein
MKCVIAGSRGIDNYEILEQAFTLCPWSGNITEIVSGRAKGVDKLGEDLAKQRNLSLTVFPAEWDIYGSFAGHKRNKDMAEYTDIAIILWDGKSRGTKNMIENMKRLDKPCIVHTIRNNEIIVEPNPFEEGLFRI